MRRDKRDKPFIWGASDDNEFQSWVETNYPDVYNEWLDCVFPRLDLYEYLDREEYEVLEGWLSHES